MRVIRYEVGERVAEGEVRAKNVGKVLRQIRGTLLHCVQVGIRTLLQCESRRKGASDSAS